MSKIYKLRQGLVAQEVDASERPMFHLRWLTRGTQFFIHHEQHRWLNGSLSQYYCTILAEDSCKCYNVLWHALEPLMEELEREGDCGDPQAQRVKDELACDPDSWFR